MAIDCQVFGPMSLAPGQNWFFWFYPNGGNYLEFGDLDWDRSVLHLVARPYFIDTWDVAENGLIVVVERESNEYRHSYRLNVRNGGPFTQWFYVAATEVKP